MNVADRAGYPVLTVPAGYGTGSNGGNPQSVVFIGAKFGEARLLNAGYAFEQATKVRKAPSVTNPSMFRCIVGSAFYTNEKCNPGDGGQEFAFAALDPAPVTPTPAAPDAPAAPAVPSAPSAPATPSTPATPAAAKKAPLIKLLTRSVRLDGKGRFGVQVTCPRGTPSCKVRILVKRTSATVGSRTITIKGGRTFTVRMRPNAPMRRTLLRGRSVTVKVSFTGFRGLAVPRTTTVKVLPRKVSKKK